MKKSNPTNQNLFSYTSVNPVAWQYFSRFNWEKMVTCLEKLRYWFAVLLVYLLSYLDQETVKGTFRSSSQTAICYYQSNHSKVEAISLSVLLKDTTSELNPTLLNAEHQTRKLW